MQTTTMIIEYIELITINKSYYHFNVKRFIYQHFLYFKDTRFYRLDFPKYLTR